MKPRPLRALGIAICVPATSAVPLAGAQGFPKKPIRLIASGIEVVASTPEQFAAAIKADMARTGHVIRQAGIRIE